MKQSRPIAIHTPQEPRDRSSCQRASWSMAHAHDGEPTGWTSMGSGSAALCSGCGWSRRNLGRDRSSTSVSRRSPTNTATSGSPGSSAQRTRFRISAGVNATRLVIFSTGVHSLACASASPNPVGSMSVATVGWMSPPRRMTIENIQTAISRAATAKGAAALRVRSAIARYSAPTPIPDVTVNHSQPQSIAPTGGGPMIPAGSAPSISSGCTTRNPSGVDSPKSTATPSTPRYRPTMSWGRQIGAASTTSCSRASRSRVTAREKSQAQAKNSQKDCPMVIS